jgi:hypothetical protein
MKKRTIISTLAAAVVIAAGAGLHYAWELISIGAAYKAKILCSGVFVSKRSPESILNNDLAADDLGILRHIDSQVNRAKLTATSNFLGLIGQTAAYRPGLGCTLVFGNNEYSQPGNRDAEIPTFDRRAARGR